MCSVGVDGKVGSARGAADAAGGGRVEFEPLGSNVFATVFTIAEFVFVQAHQSRQERFALTVPAGLCGFGHGLAEQRILPREPPHRLLIERNDGLAVAPEGVLGIKLLQAFQDQAPKPGSAFFIQSVDPFNHSFAFSLFDPICYIRHVKGEMAWLKRAQNLLRWTRSGPGSSGKPTRLWPRNRFWAG